ncbi:hypothetical protein D3C86_1756270 [compost metagenome]
MIWCTDVYVDVTAACRPFGTRSTLVLHLSATSCLERSPCGIRWDYCVELFTATLCLERSPCGIRLGSVNPLLQLVRQILQLYSALLAGLHEFNRDLAAGQLVIP